jgi:hypothetical protein
MRTPPQCLAGQIPGLCYLPRSGEATEDILRDALLFAESLDDSIGFAFTEDNRRQALIWQYLKSTGLKGELGKQTVGSRFEW